jgi:hypothetical protein
MKLQYLGPLEDHEKLWLEAFVVTVFIEIFSGRQLHQYVILIYIRLFA